MSEFADYIISQRYLNADEKAYEDISKRVSQALGVTDNERDEFHWIISKEYFTPGGRTLANAGTNRPIIPNCVVLGINDDLSDICETLKRASILQQQGCGLGFNFSNLRPAGMSCIRTGGKASGPISFMHVYSHMFKVIQQYNRSGANMGILSVEHPDILAFVNMKNDTNKFNNFNISVLLTKRFMTQLRDDPDSVWYCRWNGKDVLPRRIEYSPEMLVTDITDAWIPIKDVFYEIVHSAWLTGEPGLLFEDTINESNPLRKYLGNITATNPCGEICMYPNECCNLGSLNLEKFVEAETFNESLLRKVTRIAIRFLNRVFDNTGIADGRCAKMITITRRLGLGIMGLADCLICLRMRYDSDEGRAFVSHMLKIIDEEAKLESSALVANYGSVADRMLLNESFLREFYNCDLTGIKDDLKLTGYANIARTCIAPTGSTSMIHNVSSGIEPYFDFVYTRKLSDSDKSVTVVNKHLSGKYTVDDIRNKNIPDYFVTAQSIDPLDHVKMLSMAQKTIDNSISKTCNLPSTATVKDVADIFLYAYQSKCKGITVYRDGCRDSQILVSGCKDGSCDL